MSDLPRPRIEMEELPSPRLDFAPPEVLPLAVPAPPGGGVVPVLAGIGVLGVGLGALATGEFVFEQFARGMISGSIAAAISVIGFGLLGYGIVRELYSLFALRTVDALREALVCAHVPRVKRAARQWLASLPETDPAMERALETVEDAAAIRALLMAGPVASLRVRSDARARMAALQTAAIIAATPSAALDGLAVGWRGVRLVREIASLHGLRPGLLGTLVLLRRTALSAASVAATELAVNAATHAVLSNPLLDRLLGDMAGAGVAARRMQVLGRAAAAACSPLPPT